MLNVQAAQLAGQNEQLAMRKRSRMMQIAKTAAVALQEVGGPVLAAVPADVD